MAIWMLSIAVVVLLGVATADFVLPADRRGPYKVQADRVATTVRFPSPILSTTF
jgi:hypothetical protein